ncbi:SgcJ/EcaC family oxidoreductase [Winogradskyella flava]|uniref:SgcJ/EcaC family oxidoreductase n=1 Tax=Winogradskyella flava TaxID=1884876 RepID=UPI002492BE92|nr:SgcJ/EcaC family oxidoreductase [Winogradskyella flava]
MKKQILIVLCIGFALGCNSNKEEVKIDKNIESERIIRTIDNWNEGWDKKNVELAISDYSEDIDWTNAFGDRMRSKSELRALLKEIFAMDFVMEGTDNYQNDDVQFLTDDIALLRSTNIRTGQKWSDGTFMKDRYIHHLRVYKKLNNNWKITDHMISQAQEKK